MAPIGRRDDRNIPQTLDLLTCQRQSACHPRSERGKGVTMKERERERERTREREKEVPNIVYVKLRC